ncbi:MAG: hypothetical protein ACLF0G_07710 [Candidatus Brocadiia bacterium]
MNRTARALLLAAPLLAGGAGAEEVARARKIALDLPPAWHGVSAQGRLAARRAAELDAAALLAERVYGLQLDAQTTVLDLALASDEIASRLDHHIRGVRTREVRYTDDLIVEVTREVTLRDLVETLRKTVRQTQGARGIQEEELRTLLRETHDSVLAVVGCGAVPGSRGQRLLQARRAAELDAYRKLAEQVAGGSLLRQSQVRDLVLRSDRVASNLAATLKGARVQNVIYREDGSCEVTMAVTLREIVETVQRTVERYTRGGKVDRKAWQEVQTETRERELRVTGTGLAPSFQAVGGEPRLEVGATHPVTTEIEVIRRVIARQAGQPTDVPTPADE